MADDEMMRLGEEPGAIQEVDISRLGPALRAQMERLVVGPDSFLPVVVLEMQRTLAVLDEDQLMHVIIGAAAQFASRDVGTATPVTVLEKVLDKARSSYSREHWLEKLGPEIRRVSFAAREQVEHEANLVAWAAGELKHLSADLRIARPVIDAPTLADALRTIADALGAAA